MNISPRISLRTDLDQWLKAHDLECSGPHPASFTAAGDRLDEIRSLLGRITYRDWRAVLHEYRGTTIVQVTATVPDTLGGGMIQTSTPPVALCPLMSDGFIVDVVFQLILRFELHEAAERFCLDQRRVYFPHKANGQPAAEVRSMRHRETAGRPQP